jgi:hypothetical protein
MRVSIEGVVLGPVKLLLFPFGGFSAVCSFGFWYREGIYDKSPGDVVPEL